MERLVLTEAETDAVEHLVSDIRARNMQLDDPAALLEIAIRSHELPERLRRALLDFRTSETEPAIWFAGFPVDDAALGPTPMHWAETRGRGVGQRENTYLALCASVLGDLFAWASQQQGALVHEVAPAKGHEDLQINSGSTSALLWHTEDAFHPYRADYLALMCLRNPDHIETTLAGIGDVDLDPAVTALLFEPRFVLRPDAAHLDAKLVPEADAATRAAVERGRQRIQNMLDHPEPTSVLFGDPRSPYLSLDSAEISLAGCSAIESEALAQLMRGLDQALFGLVLEPGDIIFVDNFRAVHGRMPFSARFDGTDRWLRRVNVTRDLRRSRDSRIFSSHRTVC